MTSSVRARVGRALGALSLLACSLLVTSGAVAPPAGAAVECNVKPGGQVSDFWAQRRLNVTRPWTITRGAGVTVAVVDSGVNPDRQPQLSGITFKQGINLTADGQPRTDVRDCYGHGTAVTSILAAQPSASIDFTGIAPDVTVLPIKVANTQEDSSSELVARGIRAAVEGGADIVNVSIAGPTNTASLESAVAEAARRNVLVVAAAGNDGANTNLPAYPAALSTKYGNVIAVSALAQDDSVAEFSESGGYVDLAAPGDKVVTCAGLTDYTVQSGTSFATPYVAGAAALVRAVHPELTAPQLRNRLEQTADAPPATVPDPFYGWGVVNPYLAVTSVRSDTAGPTSRPAAQPVAARPLPPAEDRSTQNTALAISLSLVGLAALVITVAVVLRSRRNRIRSAALS